jgi:polyisoprenyl-phosphate glycosyltransferase
MKTISFIFPVYNNAQSLQLLHDEVNKKMQSLTKKYAFEYLFVNDGSRDDSLSVLKDLAAKHKDIQVLNLSRNFGHQAAVSAGLDKVSGDATIIMDADLQDPPAVCLELIEQWEAGYQVVYAQRRTRKDPLLKRLTADLYYRILSAMSSVKIPRNTGDFRLVDRKVVLAVREMHEYHRFLRGMFSFVGFSQIAVPYDRAGRHGGKSEYTIRKMVQLAKDGIFGFSDAPLRFVARIGYFVSLLSVIGIIYAITLRLFFAHITVPGWTMIVVSIFFMGGVQLIMLGVIGEYIGRIYSEVRRRPNYIVAEEINTKES